MEFFVFVCAALMILLGGLGVILRSHPVHAALSLILTLFGVAVLFVVQEAHFLAAVQVIVYAGAIVVLFLFVIMLLGVDRAEELRTDPITVQRPLAAVMGIGLVVFLAGSIAASTDSLGQRGPGIATAAMTGDPDTDVRALARSIFSDYVVAFEVTSVLLVIAVVGTVVLARRTKAVEA